MRPIALVAEADESDGSHLLISPLYAVLTSIDTDHLDYYGNLHNLQQSFRRFVRQIRSGGALVYSADDSLVAELGNQVRQEGLEGVSYGLGERAQISASSMELGADGSRFTVKEW